MSSFISANTGVLKLVLRADLLLVHTPKFATPSSRAPRTWPLPLCRASCSARAFSASIPDDRQDVYSGSHAHARNNRLQTRLFSSLETQNRDALFTG